MLDNLMLELEDQMCIHELSYSCQVGHLVSDVEKCKGRVDMIKEFKFISE